MAIEMANVLRSLNMLLDSQERREQFDVQSALAGMELSLKKRAQDIQKDQFKEEIKVAKRKAGVSEGQLGVEKEKLKAQQKQLFRQEAADLGLIIENEKQTTAASLYSAYFSDIHDSYFKVGKDGKPEYTEKNKGKFLKALTKQIGNATTAKTVANYLISYRQSVLTGKGNTEYMIKMSQLLGNQMDNKKFAVGMQNFLGIQDAFNYNVLANDFNHLLSYENMQNRLIKEQLDITKGDYKFDDDIAKEIRESKGSGTFEKKTTGIIETGEGISSEINDALANIEKLSGDKRSSAIAEFMSTYNKDFGVKSYNPQQGYVFEGGESGFKKSYIGAGNISKQRSNVQSHKNKIESEISSTSKAINKINETFKNEQRAADMQGLSLDPSVEEVYNQELAMANLGLEVYTNQLDKVQGIEDTLLNLELENLNKIDDKQQNRAAKWRY